MKEWRYIEFPLTISLIFLISDEAKLKYLPRGSENKEEDNDMEREGGGNASN